MKQKPRKAKREASGPSRDRDRQTDIRPDAPQSDDAPRTAPEALPAAARDTSPDGGTDQHPLHDDDLDDRDPEDFESEIEAVDEDAGLDVILRKRD
jgi:hypothetical protein